MSPLRRWVVNAPRRPGKTEAAISEAAFIATHDKVWGEGGWVVHYGCEKDTGQPYAIHSVKYHEPRAMSGEGADA